MRVSKTDRMGSRNRCGIFAVRERMGHLLLNRFRDLRAVWCFELGFRQEKECEESLDLCTPTDSDGAVAGLVDNAPCQRPLLCCRQA